MAWTTPRTWATSELATAAYFNTYWRDNFQALADAANYTAPSETISADQNDWNPSGLATAQIIRISAVGATRTITGIVAQPAGTFLYLINVGNETITLAHQSASSVAANRLICPNVGNRNLTVRFGALAVYMSADARWRIQMLNVFS